MRYFPMRIFGAGCPAEPSALFFVPQAQLTCIEQDGGESLAIDDLAFVDLFEQVGEFDQTKVDVLVFLRVGVSGDQAFGEKDLHRLTEKAGAGVVLDERRPLFSLIAGFLSQFADGSLEGRFARVEFARGQLPEVLACGVAVLALDDDPGVFLALGGVDGEDDDRTVVTDDVAVGFAAAGLDDVVLEDTEELAFIDDLRVEDFRGLVLSRLRARFWTGLLRGFGFAGCLGLFGRFGRFAFGRGLDRKSVV